MVTRVKTVARNITPGPESSFRALVRTFVRRARGRIESFSNRFRICIESDLNLGAKNRTEVEEWGALGAPLEEREEFEDLAGNMLSIMADRNGSVGESRRASFGPGSSLGRCTFLKLEREQ